ncbi:MAG: HAMP domain-containing histidine kinase [Clostridiales bacterium]|nr:HAMP domain-containing histidine kinase [Clostridiales bacterium]
MFNTAVTDNMLDTDLHCYNIAGGVSDLYAAGDDTQFVERFLNSGFQADKGSIYIVDRDGNIICSNVSSEEDRRLPEDLRHFLNDNIDAGHYYESQVDGDIQTVRSITPVEGTELTCVMRSVFNMVEEKDEYLRVILLPVVIAMAASVFLFVGFTGLMIRPIKEISKVVSQVSEGDFTARIDRKYTDYQDVNSIAVSSDLSDMAKTVNQMIETLENQEKDREIFISSVAHDIRTPLTSINGFVTAMIDGTIPVDNQEKYFLLIKQEVDRIRSLVMSMTEASSLSHVDPDMMEDFDIMDMVDDTIENLTPQTTEKSIRLYSEYYGEGRTLCRGEAQQLCRVLVNVVSNAVKFTPENGEIMITVTPDRKEKKCILTVEDSGPGVEPDKRSRVFESFYKVDPSRKQEGFGLGLYICKQILIGHGQTITLGESEKLHGAKFIFSFPLSSEEGK